MNDSRSLGQYKLERTTSNYFRYRPINGNDIPFYVPRFVFGHDASPPEIVTFFVEWGAVSE